MVALDALIDRVQARLLLFENKNTFPKQEKFI